MLDGTSPLLRDFWYLALPGAALHPGRIGHKRLLGEPLVIGRTKQGEVFALRDVCPHRGVPLHYGSFDGRELACAYHGWRFGPDGRCRAIPALTEQQDFDVGAVKVRAYPCRELQGNIWVYIGAAERDPESLPPPPAVPGFEAAAPQFSLSRHFPCHADHAAYGLMDPTHAAFVHTSWWWKKQARRLRRKEKHFEPAPLGWRMKRHRLPPENRVYRLLGDEVTTEITYSLPGLRVERIEGNRHSAVALTAITPIDEQATEVHQVFYWTAGWLAPLRPLLKRFAGTFLEQDLDMVRKQQEGLAAGARLLLVEDADTQALWFARLKQEWLRAAAAGRDFENPLTAKTLHWHS